MTEGPLFWYLNRATGIVLLLLLTASMVLGVLSMGGRPGRGLPRFVTQAMHRNLALLSVVTLLAHVTTAVVDDYVDIRWWQALVPVGATYEPLWLGLGTLSLDLVVAVAITSLVRSRLPGRSWRTIHLLSWLAWVVAAAHSIGIGTDLSASTGLAVVPALVCLVAVLVALAVRIAHPVAHHGHERLGEVMTGSTTARSPVPIPRQVVALPGPALLAGIEDGPTLAAHRERHGAVPELTLASLMDLVGDAGVRGRGGAAFPFATKLATASRRRRPTVVINLAEGEPASAKDSALALSRPHLVLDGAVATAGALGARVVHVVLPGERPEVGRAVAEALDERDDRVRFTVHTADDRFVAGQARAVLELMAGRPNLPVTAWTPESVSGHAGRPTLLSNAETWAQVGLLVLGGAEHYRRLGTPVEPGTTLLTLTRPGALPEVHEVALGTPWSEVLGAMDDQDEVLVGGFHGTWTRWATLSQLRVSPSSMIAAGIPLGAGVVLVADVTTCPLTFTSAVVDYLAAQSAGRCGPCFNGLPALARELRAATRGTGSPARIQQLTELVARRGACAHPDGTVRLVHSALTVLDDEVTAHLRGRCRTDASRGVAS